MQWGATHNWDVMFEKTRPPKPFNAWIPATDVKENLFTLKELDLEVGLSNCQIPQRSSAYDISITFLDDEKLTLQTWFTAWVDFVFARDRVRTISEVCRQLLIRKLNSKKQVIRTTGYLVYPKDSLYFEGSSSADVIKFQIPFVVAAGPFKA